MYLELKNLKKSFGDNKVVDDLSLEIEKGKLVCLLGPSGCGKTTTLKMIGGFLAPDSGEILLDGVNIVGEPPERRPVATVFQSYALFPHLTVLDNVIYGLKFQGLSKKKARELGREYLEIVGMKDYEKARIFELSGGQQQRVALARAMITKPKVLLLDEPLCNLDAKLRVMMREEIKTIQKEYDMTMVFVTHDQEEAMVLGDTIAIMHDGKLVQEGAPEEIYLHPTDFFARDFLGVSNHFHDAEGGEVICRPEDLVFADNGLMGTVERSEFLGFYRQYYVRLKNGEQVIVRTPKEIRSGVGEEVFLNCIRAE